MKCLRFGFGFRKRIELDGVRQLVCAEDEDVRPETVAILNTGGNTIAQSRGGLPGALEDGIAALYVRLDVL